jgi:hypothetical protein
MADGTGLERDQSLDITPPTDSDVPLTPDTFRQRLDDALVVQSQLNNLAIRDQLFAAQVGVLESSAAEVAGQISHTVLLIANFYQMSKDPQSAHEDFLRYAETENAKRAKLKEESGIEFQPVQLDVPNFLGYMQSEMGLDPEVIQIPVQAIDYLVRNLRSLNPKLYGLEGAQIERFAEIRAKQQADAILKLVQNYSDLEAAEYAKRLALSHIKQAKQEVVMWPTYDARHEALTLYASLANLIPNIEQHFILRGPLNIPLESMLAAQDSVLSDILNNVEALQAEVLADPAKQADFIAITDRLEVIKQRLIATVPETSN